MLASTEQQTVLTAHASILAPHYLAATAKNEQPLCGNKEGWGPLSPYRYDFTPCFLDVWVSSVAVFGLVFGLGAVWYLFKRCSSQPIKKDWHFYTKLVRRRGEGCNAGIMLC